MMKTPATWKSRLPVRVRVWLAQRELQQLRRSGQLPPARRRPPRSPARGTTVSPPVLTQRVAATPARMPATRSTPAGSPAIARQAVATAGARRPSAAKRSANRPNPASLRLAVLRFRLKKIALAKNAKRTPDGRVAMDLIGWIAVVRKRGDALPRSSRRLVGAFGGRIAGGSSRLARMVAVAPLRLIRGLVRHLTSLGWRGVSFRVMLVVVTFGSGAAGFLVGSSDHLAPARDRWVAIDAAWRGQLPQREPTLAAALPPDAPPRVTVDEAERDSLVDRQLGRLRAELIRLRQVYAEVVAQADLEHDELELRGDPLLDWDDAPEASIALLSRSVEHMSDQTEQLSRIIGEQRSERRMNISGRPVRNASVSSGFGMRLHPVQGTRRMHKGIDYRGEPGEPVFAVADGIVTFSGENGAYGQLVELEHSDGYLTRYAHNQANTVEVGERVNKGDVVALIGSTGLATGPHLHFEVRHRGGAVDPLVFTR